MTLLAYDENALHSDLNDRQARIVDLVRVSGFATIDSLAERFDVSAQTIRRDVIRLDKMGLLQRFHGGAGLPDDRVRLGYREKQELDSAAKERIGATASSLIPNGASVYIDVGTTADALAREIAARQLRAVYTNSMSTARILSEAPDIETYVTGGVVRGTDGSLVGDQATRALSSISVDFAFIGCSGFAVDGSPMDFDPQKIAVKQIAIEHAREVVLITDARKFERSADMRIASLQAFKCVVTERLPHQEMLGRFRSAGVEIILASARSK